MPALFFCSLIAGATPESDRKGGLLKARFVVRMIPFVKWPKSRFHEKGSPIVIGIIGDVAFSEQLERAAYGERAHKRPLLVRRLPRCDSTTAAIEALRACHVLVIGGNSGADVVELVKSVPILTVSDLPRFAGRGGCIELRIGRKLSFDFNSKAVRREGLLVSSKLLKLAKPAKSMKTKKPKRPKKPR